MRFILTFVLLFSLFMPSILPAADENGITAQSFILVEKDTFRVITGRDYHRRLAPASTTKVMTTLVAIEHLDGSETIIPDKNVVKIPRSKMNLVPGKKYRAMDLMKGTMVESANDAAYTLATHVGGSEDAFARLMTERARDIGAIDTNFENASGLTADNQYTSAYDLALIFRHALANERFLELVTTKYFLFEDSSRTIRYKNHNRLLFCFEPAIGGKTGYTRASRHCYVGAFEKNGKVYILALLASRNLWGDSVQILKTIYDDVPTDLELRQAKAFSPAPPGAVKTSSKTKKSPAKKKVAKHRTVKSVKKSAKKP
ncbi:MAG TPA: serine hydrolase [Syntrophorhabdaceae bacterium]|nr:serine hydrolase [Syntrophorhabdaceae bacterium]